MKSILLIGIGGVYNYGCEAIVRGTESIIRSRWPDARIVYASSRPEEDRKRLAGTNIEIIHRKFNRYSIKNITRKIISYAGIRWSPRHDSLKLLKGIDAVFSIGGDIFTLRPNGSYDQARPKFGMDAMKSGIPYILWGASVGPFDKNKEAESFFIKHLSGITMISAREKATVEYLLRIGISTNVIACADPAYVVGTEIEKNRDQDTNDITIGLNLSPLSLAYTGLSYDQGAIQHARAIEKIIDQASARIVLIPHVVCDFQIMDDDLRYLQHIRDNLNDTYRYDVTVVENDPGFIAIKKELIKCDIVIGARMHCAINAMSAHVPTLLLAYSQKAYGMCEYIYGNCEWVLPIQSFCDDKCINTIERLLDTKEEVSGFLAKRIPDVRKDAIRPIMVLSELI